jgi:hypothetical protein
MLAEKPVAKRLRMRLPSIFSRSDSRYPLWYKEIYLAGCRSTCLLQHRAPANWPRGRGVVQSVGSEGLRGTATRPTRAGTPGHSSEPILTCFQVALGGAASWHKGKLLSRLLVQVVFLNYPCRPAGNNRYSLLGLWRRQPVPRRSVSIWL